MVGPLSTGVRPARSVFALNVAVATVVGVLACWANWASIGILWGDSAVWLHQFERVASGDIPYRDFDFPYPPLAIWVLGVIGRIAGPEPHVPWTIMAIVAVAMCMLYASLTARIYRDRWMVPVTALTLTAAIAYSNIGSANLTTGMYIPALPFGILMLLVTVLFLCKAYEHRTTGFIWMAGAGCGAAWLCKQDVWPAALWLLVSAMFLESRHQDRSIRGRLPYRALGGFLLVVVGGLLVVGLTAGWTRVWALFPSRSIVDLNIGRALPTWRRLCLEIVAGVFLTLTWRLIMGGAGSSRTRAFLSGSAAVLAFVAVLVGFTGLDNRFRGGAPDLSATAAAIWPGTDGIKETVKELQEHVLPFFFPVAVLAVCWRFRQQIFQPLYGSPIVFLLGLSVAARLRRGFERLEWFQLLVDIPLIYLVACQLRPSLIGIRKTLAVACLASFVGAAHWAYSDGVWTRTGPRFAYQSTRGTVYLRRGAGEEMDRIKALVQQADPSGARPLFASGYTGAYSYFLNRRSRLGSTTGLWSFPDAERDLAMIREHRRDFVLIKNFKVASYLSPAPRVSFALWDLKLVPSAFMTVDAPAFEEIAAGCRTLGVVAGRGTEHQVLDCAR